MTVQTRKGHLSLTCCWYFTEVITLVLFRYTQASVVIDWLSRGIRRVDDWKERRREEGGGRREEGGGRREEGGGRREEGGGRREEGGGRREEGGGRREEGGGRREEGGGRREEWGERRERKERVTSGHCTYMYVWVHTMCAYVCIVCWAIYMHKWIDIVTYVRNFSCLGYPWNFTACNSKQKTWRSVKELCHSCCCHDDRHWIFANFSTKVRTARCEFPFLRSTVNGLILLFDKWNFTPQIFLCVKIQNFLIYVYGTWNMTKTWIWEGGRRQGREETGEGGEVDDD